MRGQSQGGAEGEAETGTETRDRARKGEAPRAETEQDRPLHRKTDSESRWRGALQKEG